MNACDLRQQVTDSLLLAHTFVAQGTLYFKQYKIGEFTHNNMEVAELYGAIGKNLFEIKSYTNALDGYVMMKNKPVADSLISICESLVQKNQVGEAYLFSSLLSYTVNFCSPNDIKSFLDEYQHLNLTTDETIDFAHGYSKIGEHDKAIAPLSRVSPARSILDSLKYASVKIEVLEKLGRYEQALYLYKSYSAMLESHETDLLSHDLLFSDKKHHSDGTINVAGKSSYVVYLNGKPYNIANTDPAQVLKSIPSSTIKQVEVITRPAQRFGESVPVINIITKGHTIEGYHINMNASGATTPKAKGAASVLGAINKVQFFAGYTYDLWGQRDRQWMHEFNYSNDIKAVVSSEENRLDRHTHHGRTMFQWEVDTLRQLYADFHINGIKRNEKTAYEQKLTTDALSSKFLSISDTWDAAMEANIIYSSRFKKSNVQKWRIGYRFTLNPDNRNYQIEELSMNSISVSKTRGRLYTHNFQLFRRVNFTKKYSLSLRLMPT